MSSPNLAPTISRNSVKTTPFMLASRCGGEREYPISRRIPTSERHCAARGDLGTLTAPHSRRKGGLMDEASDGKRLALRLERTRRALAQAERVVEERSTALYEVNRSLEESLGKLRAAQSEL